MAGESWSPQPGRGRPPPQQSLCPGSHSDLCDLVSRPDSEASSLLPLPCAHKLSPAWAPGSEAPAEQVSRSQEAGPPPPPPQVPEIIQLAYHHVHRARDASAQQTIGKVLHVLAQSYTDEVVLTLFEMEEQSQRWVGPQGGGEAPRLCQSAYA